MIDNICSVCTKRSMKTKWCSCGGNMMGQLEYFTRLKEWTKADLEDNREKTLRAVERWKEADKELERVCKELGIPKPEMVC